MDEKPRVVRFLESAQELSDDELRQALEVLSQDFKIRIKRAEQIAAMALRMGDWVEMTQHGRKLPSGAKGHIAGIRRGKIDVHFPEYGMWTLSAALVKKTDPPAESPK
jgi:hypothetical protein